MGIVMAVVMLIGLIMLFKDNRTRASTNIAALLLMAAGLWNALWYGMQHLGEFWGYAGFVSGVTMLVTALFLWFSKSAPPKNTIKILIACALSACFLLYFVTLIQLNLGHEIIR